MALKAHNSVKLGVRPSFSLISSNSSAVSLSCSAVFTLISMVYFCCRNFIPDSVRSQRIRGPGRLFRSGKGTISIVYLRQLVYLYLNRPNLLSYPDLRQSNLFSNDIFATFAALCPQTKG